MKVNNLGYSLKNIPIPPKKKYLKSITETVESFITRLSWKVHFLDRPNDTKPDSVMIFRFKSNITPPSSNDSIVFENDMYGIIRTTWHH